MKFAQSLFAGALLAVFLAMPARAATNHSEIFTLTDSSVTVSGNSTSMGTAQTEFYSADFYLSVTSVTGSTPTLTPVIQMSPDSGSTWFNHPTSTFSVINATTSVAKLNVDVGGATDVRLSYTVTGSSASFRTKVWGVVRKK